MQEMSIQDQKQQKRALIQNLKTKIKIDVKKINEERSKINQSPQIQYKSKLKHKETVEELKKFTLLSKYKEVCVDLNFNNCFTVEEKLGEGAHSSVYRCVHKQTQFVYAVKIFKKMNQELFENVKQTYQIMKKLSHPYIVQGKFLFVTSNQNSCQLVTEYFPYEDLRLFLSKKQNQKILPTKTIVSILDKVLETLQYLQEQGVCHRDIKPQNILYDQKTGEIKLIDFELSRMPRYTNEKIELWTNTGSLHYRAPESFNGGYNNSIDMWAVGIMAYEMLVGKLPFHSKYDAKIIRKICHQELNFDNLDLSQDAQNFLNKILCKDPAKRIKPKEARCHPFFLKNLKFIQRKKSLKQHNSSFEVETPTEEGDDIDTRNNFYDEDVEFSFLSCLSEDIGIRIMNE